MFLEDVIIFHYTVEVLRDGQTIAEENNSSSCTLRKRRKFSLVLKARRIDKKGVEGAEDGNCGQRKERPGEGLRIAPSWLGW